MKTHLNNWLMLTHLGVCLAYLNTGCVKHAPDPASEDQDQVVPAASMGQDHEGQPGYSSYSAEELSDWLAQSEIECTIGQYIIFDGNSWQCSSLPSELPAITQSSLAQSESVVISENGVIHANLVAPVAGSALGFSGTLVGDIVGVKSETSVVGIQGQAVADQVPSDNQILRYDATEEHWAPSDRATMRQRLASVEASDQSEVVFTNIPAGFTRIIVTLDNVNPASNDVNISFELSTDSGNTWIDTGYQWAISGWRAGSGSFAVRESISSSLFHINFPDTPRRLSSDSIRPFFGDIIVFGYDSTTAHKVIDVTSNYFSAAGNPVIALGAGSLSTTSIIDGIKIFMSSGNIASGTFTLYGKP